MSISKIRKAILVVALLIIPFSSLSVLLLPQPIHAAGSWDSKTMDMQLKTYMNYHAIGKCMEGINSYNAEQASNNEGTGKNVSVGILLDSSGDHRRQCKTLMGDAVKSFGYATIADALVDWGYKLEGDKFVYKGSDRTGDRIRAIRNKVFGGKEPTLTNAQKYYLYRQSFTLFCSPSNKIAESGASSSVKQLAQAGQGYAIVTDIDSSGKTDNIYKVTKAADESVVVLPEYIATNIDGVSEWNSCKEMGENTKKYADDYKNWFDAQDDETKEEAGGSFSDTPGDDDDIESSCKVAGLGWIICPVFSFLGNVTDATYSAVSYMLQVRTLTDQGANTPVYAAWSTMRNIANAAFIIAIIIIVFSQVTSFGISNYGIKKLLPRVVISAILVNLSYWLCAILVDVSNIIGASLNNLIAGAIDPTKLEFSEGGVFSGQGWAGLVGGILAFSAAGVSIYLLIGALAPALITAVISILMAFLVLTLRQVLILLLIVLAPLAFVAFLLPNTESLFKKWKGLFQSLLVMYPLIAILFGASSLASTIIMGSADQVAGGNKGMTIVIQIMGALASVIPLAVTPFIVKLSNGIAGMSILSRLNDPNKGPFDRMRKWGQERADNSAWSRGRRTRKALGASRKNRQFAQRYNDGRALISGSKDERDEAEARLGRVGTARAKQAYRSAAGVEELAGRQVSRASEAMQDSKYPQAINTIGAVLATTQGKVNTATGANDRDEDVSEMGAHFQAEVAKSLEDSMRDAVRAFSREMTKVDPGKRDDEVKAIIAGGNAQERETALHYAASMGRDGIVRDYRDQQANILSNGRATDEQKAAAKSALNTVNQAINANAGSLLGKAPDLVKGTVGGFNGSTPEQFAGFSEKAVAANFKHIEDSYKGAQEAAAKAAATPGDTDLRAAATKAQKQYNDAIAALNNNIKGIAKDTEAQNKFGTKGKDIHALHAGLNPAIQGRIDITHVNTDGTIS